MSQQLLVPDIGDFDEVEVDKAIDSYQDRDRRFGARNSQQKIG